jgi:hydroxymethylpyrimidine pyrophosphatase-like HAD family hydrolase
MHLDLVRPIRVYACDIDGCLAEPGHAAYDLGRLHAIAELNRASASDPTVPVLTLVTGRPHPYVDAVMQTLDVRLPASFENGAGLATRHPYRAWLLPEAGAGREALRRMIEIVEARDDVFLQMGKVASLSVFAYDRERPLHDLADGLQRLVDEHDLALDIDPSTDCVNVLPPGVDKAVGFRALCAAAGVEAEAVAGIGDSVGDLPWLRLCGISVAPLVSADAVRAGGDPCLGPSRRRGGAGDLRGAGRGEPGVAGRARRRRAAHRRRRDRLTALIPAARAGSSRRRCGPRHPDRARWP